MHTIDDLQKDIYMTICTLAFKLVPLQKLRIAYLSLILAYGVACSHEFYKFACDDKISLG